jgi:hypothetical protein
MPIAERILLFLAGLFFAASISPHVDGPSWRVFERSNFPSKHRSLTTREKKRHAHWVGRRKRLPHVDAQGFTDKWRRRFRLRTDFFTA